MSEGRDEFRLTSRYDSVLKFPFAYTLNENCIIFCVYLIDFVHKGNGSRQIESAANEVSFSYRFVHFLFHFLIKVTFFCFLCFLFALILK